VTRRRLSVLARVAISACLLALLFRTVGVAEVAAELRAARPLPLLGAVALYCVLGTWVRALRWRALVVSLGQPITLRRVTELFLVGTLFNQLLPTGLGGDVVRSLMLAREGMGRARALNTVIVDRALGILPLLAVGLAAVLLAPGRAAAPVTGALLVTGTAATVALVMLFRAHRWRRRLERVPGLGWLARRPAAARFADSFGEYHGRALAGATSLALAFTFLLVATNALLGRAVGIHGAGLADWAVVVPLASLSLLLPSVGGWGVREWTYVGLLGLLHPPVGAHTATAVSLLFGALNLLLAAAGALLTVTGGSPGLPDPGALEREAPPHA